ncbi:hypothetical protein Agub_g7348 [Astrephomene gubernaculifera]|uniref:Uncharacterized protein n=1 Tax=Astrephomene gubernaculifera TaxID=47775 RepID=A0AAD3HM77_9CHLO|nr:hypothetical protein Agub_g7348 [Astrephomene gubernaculifera]
MGKNQSHKAMQRTRYNGGGGGTEEAGGGAAYSDGMKDVTFHTAEWHAARIAALQVERLPWEEWRQKQKEAEGKLAAAAEEEERLMREYRAQLDADRTKLLARGRNHTDLAKELKKDSKKRKRKDGKSDKKSKKSKKEGKDRKKKSKKSKKRRTSSSSDSSSSSGSDSDSGSSSDEGDDEDNDPNKPMRLSDWLKM